MKILYLVTGLPRSGKTSFIRKRSKGKARLQSSVEGLIEMWLDEHTDTGYLEIATDFIPPQQQNCTFHYHLIRQEGGKAADVYIVQSETDITQRMYMETMALDGAA